MSASRDLTRKCLAGYAAPLALREGSDKGRWRRRESGRRPQMESPRSLGDRGPVSEAPPGLSCGRPAGDPRSSPGGTVWSIGDQPGPLESNLRFCRALRARRGRTPSARESGRRPQMESPRSLGDRGPVSEAPPGFEPGIEDLQSSALPLGHGAENARGAGSSCCRPPPSRERETGLEPATPTLARLCSTN